MNLRKTQLTRYFGIPVIILAFLACSKSPKTSNPANSPLYPQQKPVIANPKGGYVVNIITGDSIKPIILESGDSLISGIPVPAKGKLIHPDSVEQPKKFKVPPNEQLSKNSFHTKSYEVPHDLSIVRVNHKSLTKVTLKDVSKKDTAHYIINSTGDKVKTGVPISVKGQRVKTTYPEPKSSRAPAFKDAAIYDIQYLDVDQGMASSYINSILEDQIGNIWFGTNGGGVTKYDGSSFTHFTEKEGLSNNKVSCIQEDDDGNIWLATLEGGISKYDGNSFTHFTEKEGLSSNKVYTMKEDKDGNLWLATLGGGVSKYDGSCFTHFTKNEGLNSNYVLSIVEDDDGNLWFGTWGSGVTKYDGSSFTYFTEKEGLSNNYVITIFKDMGGNLWFGTNNGGVTRYDGASFTHLTKKEGLSNNSVRSITQDKSGNLWFGTFGGGVSKYDGSSLTHFTEEEGLSNNKISSITEDKSGNLWFGTWGAGVSKYDPSSFAHFTEKEGLGNSYVRSIFQDKIGNLWFGTDGGGVTKFDGAFFTQFTKNQNLSHNKVFSIAEDKDGNLWFGTYGGGVSKYDGNFFTHFTENEGLSSNYVRSILEDQKGNLWFGTYGGGVSKYDGTSFTHFTEKEGLSNNYVFSIIEDKSGNIWFGTYGGGVSKYDGTSFTHFTEKEGLIHNRTHSGVVDNAGNLWFGTYGGVIKYDGASFSNFTEAEGLSNNIIWSILEDKNNRLWIGTEKGLSYLKSGVSEHDSNNVKELPITVQTLTKEDGIKGLDFVHNSALIDKSNRAWWGTGKSLNMLNLREFKTAKQPPNVFLKQLDISEQFIDYRNLPDTLFDKVKFEGVQRLENYPLDLRLPYDKNHLTFHFVGIDWNAPHKIQYRYRMTGLDSKWSKPTNSTSAEYRNMPDGKYIFQIKAIGESGEWSEPFNYEFTISPPWYETTLYYVLQTGFLLFLVLLAVMLQRSQKGKGWIIILSFVVLITVFEFLLILIEPYIDDFSAGIPIVKLAVNVGLALSIYPVERMVRSRLRNDHEVNK